jgi:hypothetical protein
MEVNQARSRPGVAHSTLQDFVKNDDNPGESQSRRDEERFDFVRDGEYHRDGRSARPQAIIGLLHVLPAASCDLCDHIAITNQCNAFARDRILECPTVPGR